MLAIVLLNAFSTPLMLSSVNVALPMIAEEFQMSAVMLSWVPMAYLMASAMFVLLFGYIADIFGRKRIFLYGTVAVILTSLFAGYAHNAYMLIIGRFLQGMSAAMLYATQIALISSIFPKAQRGRMIGLTVAMVYWGLTFGPLIGGYVVEQFSWRASFMIQILPALLVVTSSLIFIKADWYGNQDKRHFDVSGALIYMITIALLCFSVSCLPHFLGFLLLGLALICLYSFVQFEKRQATPFFNIEQFLNNRIFCLSCFASLIIYTATFANVVQINLYLQYLRDFSPTKSGVIVMLQPLSMALSSLVIGYFSGRFNPYTLSSIGMLLAGLGLAILATLTPDSHLGILVVATLIIGLGFGLFSPSNVNIIMDSVDRDYYGKATGLIATMRIVGQMGSMILVTLVFSVLIGSTVFAQADPDLLLRTIRSVFIIGMLLCFVPGLYLCLARR